MPVVNTWINSDSDQDWTNDNNWDLGHAPTSDESAYIDESATVPPDTATMPSAITLAGLNVAGGVYGHTYGTGDWAINGDVGISGATLSVQTISGSLYVNWYGFPGFATLVTVVGDVTVDDGNEGGGSSISATAVVGAVAVTGGGQFNGGVLGTVNVSSTPGNIFSIVTGALTGNMETDWCSGSAMEVFGNILVHMDQLDFTNAPGSPPTNGFATVHGSVTWTGINILSGTMYNDKAAKALAGGSGRGGLHAWMPV